MRRRGTARGRESDMRAACLAPFTHLRRSFVSHVARSPRLPHSLRSGRLLTLASHSLRSWACGANGMRDVRRNDRWEAWGRRRAAQGSVCKVGTQDPENLDEELKPLVTVWFVPLTSLSVPWAEGETREARRKREPNETSWGVRNGWVSDGSGNERDACRSLSFSSHPFRSSFPYRYLTVIDLIYLLVNVIIA